MTGLNMSTTELPDLIKVAIPWSVPTKGKICLANGIYRYTIQDFFLKIVVPKREQ